MRGRVRVPWTRGQKWALRIWLILAALLAVALFWPGR